MPSSSVRTFTDPDDYAGSVRATTAEMTITGRGPFTANLIRVDLHHLCMGRFSDNLPRIVHVTILPERTNISFRTQPGASIVTSGLALHQTEILEKWADPQLDITLSIASLLAGLGERLEQIRADLPPFAHALGAVNDGGDADGKAGRRGVKIGLSFRRF